jgi:hypothetical protein
MASLEIQIAALNEKLLQLQQEEKELLSQIQSLKANAPPLVDFLHGFLRVRIVIAQMRQEIIVPCSRDYLNLTEIHNRGGAGLICIFLLGVTRFF